MYVPVPAPDDNLVIGIRLPSMTIMVYINDCGHCEALRELRLGCPLVLEPSTGQPNVIWRCDHCTALEDLCRRSSTNSRATDVDGVKEKDAHTTFLEEQIRVLNLELTKKKELIAKLERTVQILLGPKSVCSSRKQTMAKSVSKWKKAASWNFNKPISRPEQSS